MRIAFVPFPCPGQCQVIKKRDLQRHYVWSPSNRVQRLGNGIFNSPGGTKKGDGLVQFLGTKQFIYANHAILAESGERPRNIIRTRCATGNRTGNNRFVSGGQMQYKEGRK